MLSYLPIFYLIRVEMPIAHVCPLLPCLNQCFLAAMHTQCKQDHHCSRNTGCPYDATCGASSHSLAPAAGGEYQLHVSGLT